MCKYLFLLVFGLVFAVIPCSSQKKTDLSVYMGWGSSVYRGDGAASFTTYYISDVRNIPNEVGDPYGRRSITNFMLGARANRWLGKQWLLSVNAQYEQTGGALSITKAQSRTGLHDTVGDFQKKIDFISVNPQAGFRVLNKKVSVVVNAGVDYAFHIAGTENAGLVDHLGGLYQIGYAGVSGNNDFRLTGGILVTLKKWGLDLNYKHGLTNYWEGHSEKVYSRLYHFRLLYRVWQKKTK